MNRLRVLQYLFGLRFSLADALAIGAIAAAAADAAACTAMESTLTATSAAYQEGLVDSGLISQVDSLIGEQVRGVLSSGLSQDLADLVAIVDSAESVETAKAKVAELTASIKEKCSAVGVVFAN